METSEEQTKQNVFSITAKFGVGIFLVSGIVIAVSIFFLVQINKAPNTFPVRTPIVIKAGMSAADVVEVFENVDAIKSQTFLYTVLLLRHDPADVKAGTYVFNEPLTATQLAAKVTGTAPPAEVVTLTFPEGLSNRVFAEIANDQLEDFSIETFLNLASSSEGMLFPDTYNVTTDYSADDLFTLLTNTHEAKLSTLPTNTTDLTDSEVVILASILEREANSEESMRTVAGILFNRLDEGMALQVDATMEYILDTPLNELRPGELAQNIREIDSPYNTYLNTGLTPTPIGNPGLQALTAVLQPIDSDYFFYITGDDGNFYYARTFDQHRANIARYLR